MKREFAGGARGNVKCECEEEKKVSEVSSINSAAAIHSSIEIRNIIGKCIFYFSISSTLNRKSNSGWIKLQSIDDVMFMPEPEQDTPHTSWRAVTRCVGERVSRPGSC